MSSYFKLLGRLLATVQNWPMYFLNKFGLTGEYVRYKLRSGFTVTSRKYRIDGSCLNEVWFDLSYDPNAFGIPFDWRTALTIVDAGGNIGVFTLFAATHAPRARIYTLEPEPGNLAILNRNIEENHLGHRVETIQAGVGDGKAQTLYMFALDPGGNSVYRTSDGGTPLTIQTMTLSTLFADKKIETCDYLKLDCEGAEYEALYSLSADELKRIRCIGLEYHHFSKDPRHTSGELEKFLVQNGFRVIRHKKSMMFAIR